MSNPQPQPTPAGSTVSLASVEAALIGLYVGAEAFLLAQVTRILKRVPVTPLGTLTARASIRQLAFNILNQLETRTAPLVQQVIETAVRDGGRVPPLPGVGSGVQGPSGGALATIGGGAGGGGGTHGGFLPPGDNPGFDPYQLHGVRAANAIRDDLTSELQDVRFRLTRLDDDIYKLVNPAGAAGQVLPNGYTPEQAQAKAWREFVSRGVTGFTDKSGRDWALSSYVEMAVRTASSRAYNASRLQVLQYQGINLCTVSDTGHPCPLCFPWQGVILAITPDGVHPSVADAIAAGLGHPNCRHSFSAFLPGFSTLPIPQVWTEGHAIGYKATQKQRALERAIRQAKREALYALTPQAAQDARTDIRQGQAALRDFLAQNPDLNLLRQSRREQLNFSNATVNVLPYGG